MYAVTPVASDCSPSLQHTGKSTNLQTGASDKDPSDTKTRDHSGEPRSFLNAQIYVNEDEVSAEELQGLGNIVPVSFADGEGEFPFRKEDDALRARVGAQGRGHDPLGRSRRSRR